MARARTIQDIITAIDVLGVEGPGEGLRVELDPEVPLLIGRGLRGLEVPDPHVSLQHARIEWDEQHYVLVDLGSAKGTVLEGQSLAPDKPAKVVIGNRFVVGSTTFELVERHASWRRAAELSALGAMGLVLLGALIFVVMPRREAEVALLWYDPIHQGARSNRELALDTSYLRLRGIDPYRLRIRRVTDADKDGTHEVWLRSESAEYVITFDREGRWRHLGELPLNCADVRSAGSAGLPMLECGPVTWAILNGDAYEPLNQSGVVLWGVPRDAWTKAGYAPSHLVGVWQASLRRSTTLAGFLAANGVDEPVHYLLCEHGLPGVPALVLTASDRLRTLGTGCRGQLDVDGLSLESVRAVAFTATGQKALMDDMQMHLSGAPDGVFRPTEHDALAAAWTATPEAASVVLAFDAPDHFFEPVAPEGGVASGRRLPSAYGSPPKATTATLVGTGKVTLDPPGCSVLEVETGPWTCQLAQGCMSGLSFLTVRDVGCGEAREVLGAPYSSTVADGQVEGLDVRARVEASELGDRVDVLRVRVAWRPQKVD